MWTMWVLASLVASATLAAGDKDWFQKLVTERYTPAVRAALLPEAKAGSERPFKTEDAQWQYIYSFFRGYLHALEDTHGTMTVGEHGGPLQTGYDAGILYFHHLQSSTNQSFRLTDFGYVPTTAHGTYHWAREESDFQPDGTNENWWVSFQVGVTDRFAAKRSEKEGRLFNIRRPCTFKGFLSPDNVGFTGHMNQYDRDFIVTEIGDIGSPPAEPVNQEIEVKIEEGPTTPRTVPEPARGRADSVR